MRKQVVNVDFKEDQGVILNWNFIDILRKTKYFRHILILITSNYKEAFAFIENYIKMIKPGDIFTTVYKNPYQQVQIKEWREKNGNHQFSIRNYIKTQQIQNFNIQQGFQLLQRSLQEIEQQPIVNFLLEKPQQIEILKKRIKLAQSSKKMRFINTIFSPLRDNAISVSEGINHLSTKEPDILEFYHQYINQVAIQSAHLVVTCRNGQISSCTQADWTNTAFNKLQRYYFAPTTKYKQDILHIINNKITYSGSYDLDVCLSLKCFDGVVYRSEKKIVINFNHSEFYNRTVMVAKRKRVFLSAEDIQFEENPHYSQTLIRFQRKMEGENNEQI